MSFETCLKRSLNMVHRNGGSDMVTANTSKSIVKPDVGRKGTAVGIHNCEAFKGQGGGG